MFLRVGDCERETRRFLNVSPLTLLTFLVMKTVNWPEMLSGKEKKKIKIFL